MWLISESMHKLNWSEHIFSCGGEKHIKNDCVLRVFLFCFVFCISFTISIANQICAEVEDTLRRSSNRRAGKCKSRVRKTEMRGGQTTSSTEQLHLFGAMVRHQALINREL